MEDVVGDEEQGVADPFGTGQPQRSGGARLELEKEQEQDETDDADRLTIG